MSKLIKLYQMIQDQKKSASVTCDAGSGVVSLSPQPSRSRPTTEKNIAQEASSEETGKKISWIVLVSVSVIVSGIIVLTGLNSLSEYRSMKIAYRSMQAANLAISDQIQEQNVRITSLEKSIGQISTQVQSDSKEVSELKKRISKVSDDLKAAKELLSGFTSDVDILKKKFAAYEKNQERLLNELQDLKKVH